MSGYHDLVTRDLARLRAVEAELESIKSLIWYFAEQDKLTGEVTIKIAPKAMMEHKTYKEIFEHMLKMKKDSPKIST